MSQTKLEKEDKIKYICNHIEYCLPHTDILIADSTFDEFIPEGVIFIIPEGAIQLAPHDTLLSEPDINNGGLTAPYYIPKLLFTLPDLTFKIDASGVVSGMSLFAQKFASKLNANE